MCRPQVNGLPLPNVYGERQNIADRYRNVFAIFMNNARRGLSMPAFGDGLQTRAFCDLYDVAAVIARTPVVRASANEAIGADTPYTILEPAQEMRAALGVQPAIEHVLVDALCDRTKVRQAFDEPQPIGVATGPGRMAACVREHDMRDLVKFASEIEIDRNLPPSWATTATGNGS